MRRALICSIVVFLAFPAARVDASSSMREDAHGDGNVSGEVKERLLPARFRMDETLTLSGRRLESPMVSRAELNAQRAGSDETSGMTGMPPSRSVALAMLGSAVLPGLGELYVATGSRKVSHYLRVPLFLGLDIWFWYGYRNNYDKGKEVKAEYEAFGDAHWSEERFLQQHPYCDGIGGCDDWQQYNEEARESGRYFFVYIPKELDREEYYENMGKYDAFAFGWDDWNGDYDNFEPWTPNRTEYWAMRAESDDYLLTADRFVMALIVNRVVSMLDAGWLAYRYNKGEYDDEGWTLELKPGTEASSLGLAYRF
jgi:hypothetical protein